MSLEKKFQKKIEDFICENCNIKVQGSGFTNHCPQCFFSKHVDINPGDRAATCQGLMKPIAYETQADKEMIVFQCQKCNHRRKNKIQENDNKENLRQIIKDLAKQ